MTNLIKISDKLVTNLIDNIDNLNKKMYKRIEFICYHFHKYFNMSTHQESSEIPDINDNSIDDADEIIEEIDEIVPKAVRGKGIIYDFIIQITEEELEELNCKKNKNGIINQIEFDDSVWKYKYTRDTSDGLKSYFKCSPKNQKCECMIYLVKNNDSIQIYQSQQDHNHVIKIGRGIKPYQ